MPLAFYLLALVSTQSSAAPGFAPTADEFFETLLRDSPTDSPVAGRPIAVPHLHVSWSADVPAPVRGRVLLNLVKRGIWIAPSGLSYDLSRTVFTEEAPPDDRPVYDEPHPMTALPFAGLGCDPRLLK